MLEPIRYELWLSIDVMPESGIGKVLRTRRDRCFASSVSAAGRKTASLLAIVVAAFSCRDRREWLRQPDKQGSRIDIGKNRRGSLIDGAISGVG